MPDTARLFTPSRPRRPNVMARWHVVVSGHYWASQAGFQILEAGGNAIDAGVATGLAIDVLESQFVGFGGVAPIMIYLADSNEVVTINGVGPWPRAASAAYFRDRYDGRIPDGLLHTVVPAAPANWIAALARYGTMSFAEVAARGDPFRARRLSDLSVLHRDHHCQAARHPRLADDRRDLPARRPPPTRRRNLRAGRSGTQPAIHGGPGTGARRRRPPGRIARRARRVLRRRHCRRDRAPPVGEWRAAGRGRSGILPGQHRTSVPHELRRLRHLRLRRLVAGADGAGGAEHPGPAGP